MWNFAFGSNNLHKQCNVYNVHIHVGRCNQQLAPHVVLSHNVLHDLYVCCLQDNMTTTMEQNKAACNQRMAAIESQIGQIDWNSSLSRCRICFKETEGSVGCEGNRSSCSGWSDETSPSWTAPFTDNTDDRPGGCEYQWRIECTWLNDLLYCNWLIYTDRPHFFHTHLARSANFPGGLCVLLALIFNDFLQTSYVRIHWTDFCNFFYKMIGICS